MIMPQFRSQQPHRLHCIHFITVVFKVKVRSIGNKSVPKIIINNAIIFKTAIRILLISNHNSF